MSTGAYLQNIVLLAAAVGLAIYFRNGWSFLLLLFWLRAERR